MPDIIPPTAAPAASTPSAAPTPAPAAAPAPAPAPASGSTPASDLSAPEGNENPFAELDAKFAADPTRPPEKPSAAPAATAKPAAAVKPGETVKPAATAKPGAARQPAELRQELDRLKGELATRNESYSALEKKIADYEKRGQDTAALNTRLQEMEKRINERESELRALKQEASPEFKEKWDKPFDQAADFAKNQIQGLTYTNPETAETRPATWDDFVEVYRLPVAKAAAAARQVFGDNAPLVMQHMNELKRLDYQRGRALEAERTQAKERAAAEAGQAAQRQEQINAAWERVNKELPEKVEEYRDPPDDSELIAARQEGFKIFDAEAKTVRQQIVKNAEIRQRVAAFVPMKLRLGRLAKQLADTKAQLDSALGSGSPVGGKRTGGSTPDTNTESWEEAARKAMPS